MKLRLSQPFCIALLAGAFLVLSDGHAATKVGLASWYGPGFEGQPTASGEIFDPHGFTAAHNTLPLGTELIVSYGGRAVKVVVNDRGPHSAGRELDLSQCAAEYLGLTHAGVDYVDYSVAGGGGYGGGEPTQDATASASEAQYSSDGRGTSGETFVVESGDTLSGIAAELVTSVEDLAANGIDTPDLLYAGQTLRY